MATADEPSSGSASAVISKNQALEGININDVLKFLAIFFDHMENKRFDIFPLDKLKKFKTSRVEQVVARHCLVDDVENQLKRVIVCHESLVEGILETDQGAEEFEGDLSVLAMDSASKKRAVHSPSLRCFCGARRSCATRGASDSLWIELRVRKRCWRTKKVRISTRCE